MASDMDMSYNLAVETLNTDLLSLWGWHEESSRLKYEGKMDLIIPMINKLIHRSGLTDDEVDKLRMIHITGTKGKGSTSAFTESILRHYGYRTGLFTSPHLVEVRERIRVNGRPLSKEKYCLYFWKVYNRLKNSEEPGHPIEEGKGMPAYFAFNLILSLHIFLNEGVDVVIMEVGIGGLYDSTNFIRNPVACAITSLGLEHTNYLGDTIESIAWQKSGIFKKHRPAVTAPQSHSALQVILNRAKETQSPLYVVQPLSEDLLTKYNFTLSIAGDKQRHNAALAVQLFHLWEAYLHKNDLVSVTQDTNVEEIPVVNCTTLDDATVAGLSTCKWPGRAQTIHRSGITYYLDGAHTKESMEMCASWFTQAADKEKEMLKGKKVVRVLLFFTLPERDPELLIYPLKNCEFDAAVFSPFVVSTLESQNRPDLQLKKLDPKIQSATVERNKLAWDKLMATRAREKTNLCLLQAGWPVEVMSSSLPTPHIGSDGESEKSSITCESDASDIMSVASDKMSVESCEDVDLNDRTVTSSNLPASIGAMLNYVIEPNLICNATLLGEMDNLNELLQEKVTVSASRLQEQPSIIFPCILEAVAWAGQGRDSSIEVLDPLPAVPSFLADADHIQILATGSLNYIGGVLDALASQGGELYS